MLALGSSSGVQAAEPLAPAVCPISPTISGDFPDPSVLAPSEFGGRLTAYATNTQAAAGTLNVPVTTARDAAAASWAPLADALPQLPAWARAGFTWAPSVVHTAAGPYRLYFTARYGFSGRPCIGVAVSGSALGPFTPTDQVRPLVCPLGEGGAIDPSVFRDDDGTEFLLWKTDTNCCDGPPTLYLQQLSADGLSLVGPHAGEAPWLLPDAAPLIRRDQPWEGRVIEAPTLIKRNGRYHLFYSGGDYGSAQYAVGYASSAALLGPYEKAPAPILTSASSGLEGPGGQDLFEGADGRTWMAFHAWRTDGTRRIRPLFLAPVDWTLSGPVVLTGCPPQSDADR